MLRHHDVVVLLAAIALSLAGCAVEPASGAGDRDQALRVLEGVAGAAAGLDFGPTGATRVLAMTPLFHVPTRDADPAVAAARFLSEHHDVFQLDADEAASFAVTRVDVDPGTGVRHVTLQRFHDGDAVFQGAITVHMDAANGVFRALGDDSYRISPPVNQRVLTTAEAVAAARRALGLGTIEPIQVARRIVQVGRDDSRFAYQVLLSWRDAQRQLQYQLVLVDAASGDVLASHDLVDTFTG